MFLQYRQFISGMFADIDLFEHVDIDILISNSDTRKLRVS